MEHNNGNPVNNSNSSTGAEPVIDNLGNPILPNLNNLPLTPELVEEFKNANSNPDNPDNNSNTNNPDLDKNNSNNNTSTTNTLSTDDVITSLMSNDIKEEDKQFRDSLFQLLKGTSFDQTGNIIDAEGKIVLSTTSLKQYLESETLPLDKEGNAVNEKGEIIIPKEQLLENSAIVAPIKNTLETNFNFKLPEDFQIEETEEGIVNLVKTAVETLTENSVKRYLESNPVVKSFVDHLLLGGQPENFVNTHIDYKAVDINQLTESQKKDFLDKMFTKQNNPAKDNLINLLMNSGKDVLDQNVQAAITYLDTQQQKENEHKQALLAQEETKRQEQIEKYWNTVEAKVLKEGKLSQITIPIAEREAFYNYLSKPITKEGYSQDMLDAQKDEIDFDLLVSFLRFKKVDLSYLANLKAKENKVQSLRDRFKSYKHLSGNGGNPVTHNHNSNTPDSVSLDAII